MKTKQATCIAQPAKQILSRHMSAYQGKLANILKYDLNLYNTLVL